LFLPRKCVFTFEVKGVFFKLLYYSTLAGFFIGETRILGIIFFLPKWYQYFIIFQGFSDNLMLCEIPDAIIKIGEKHD